RLVSALGSTIVRVGLILCTLPTGVAAVLCVGGWHSRDWSMVQKLHYSAFVLLLFVTLISLFALGAG
ncbi:MAG: hypothetical protein KAQ74_05110, partial [Dehalococcoidia bacterium]|nr:hypothetical protein [Dehalococcoidia bacterium]